MACCNAAPPTLGLHGAAAVDDVLASASVDERYMTFVRAPGREAVSQPSGFRRRVSGERAVDGLIGAARHQPKLMMECDVQSRRLSSRRHSDFGLPESNDVTVTSQGLRRDSIRKLSVSAGKRRVPEGVALRATAIGGRRAASLARPMRAPVPASRGLHRARCVVQPPMDSLRWRIVEGPAAVNLTA
jgi:hypothetical protein